MTNSTTSPVPLSGFNLLYKNWSVSQHEIYSVLDISASSALRAFVTVLTQYVISQWIWSSMSKNNHNSPVYIVSGAVYFFLWYMLMNGLLAPGQAPIGIRIAVPLLAYGGVLLNLLFCWIWSRLFNKTNKNKMDDDDEQGSIEETVASPPTEAVEDAELGQKPTQESGSAMATVKPKVDYINNIKIFLTCLVIVHHVLVFGFLNFTAPVPILLPVYVFSGLNQSYFMSLFFFFSGYFSPRSLNKKGTYMFLFDKLKRLGIPLIITLYLWHPFAEEGMSYLIGQNPEFSQSLVGEGVAWFVQQLIIFNIVYAFACGEGWAPKIKCPSLLSFFGMSLLLGLLAALLSLFFPPAPACFFTVPLFWIYYPSYILFFFGGALAQVNNWMDEIKDKSRLVIYAWTIICIAIGATVSLFGMEYTFLQPLQVAVGAAVGIPISLAVTVFFHDFVNKKYTVTPFFSKAMYTSYLVQMVTVYAAIKCWFLIVGAVGSDGILINLAGLIFTSMLGLVFTWTLGYAIVSIPGFSQVL